jgi:hypothetical protein
LIAYIAQQGRRRGWRGGCDHEVRRNRNRQHLASTGAGCKPAAGGGTGCFRTAPCLPSLAGSPLRRRPEPGSRLVANKTLGPGVTSLRLSKSVSPGRRDSRGGRCGSPGRRDEQGYPAVGRLAAGPGMRLSASGTCRCWCVPGRRRRSAR